MNKRLFYAKIKSFQNINMVTIWLLLGSTLNFFTAKPANTVREKQKSEPFGSDFLVDDTRLELVTSRTSSGCATSCANRPYSFVGKGYSSKRHRNCQGFFKAARKNSGSFHFCSEAGRNKTLTCYGAGTQTLQLAATPPHSAMISAQPGPTAVTRPVSSTVTMLSSEERHSSFAVVTASTG